LFLLLVLPKILTNLCPSLCAINCVHPSKINSTTEEAEEEEDEESRTLHLRAGQVGPEAAEDVDEDTDSEDTLGLLQQSQALITRQ
jgi:hypothetical protein